MSTLHTQTLKKVKMWALRGAENRRTRESALQMHFPFCVPLPVRVSGAV